MFVNETGNKYGRWTVIKRVENNYRGNAQWLCKCDCGNEKVVTGIALRSGRSQSCGCLQKEKVRDLGYNNTPDLIGQRFGKLIVKERIVGDKKNKGKWLCECDCGSETKVLTNHLISGHTQSCGCVSSFGEVQIANILSQYGIIFSKEYTFPELKSEKNYALRFDFAIFNHNNTLVFLIECDGKQHQDPKNGYWNKDLFHNDKLKDQYCNNNNIVLYRIQYKDKADISKEVKDILIEQGMISE